MLPPALVVERCIASLEGTHTSLINLMSAVPADKCIMG
jgi:hypothetical protein